MIPRSLPLLVLALSSVLSAPGAPGAPDDRYTEVVERGSKRAALVLDRLLVALQQALRNPLRERGDGPRSAALIAGDKMADGVAAPESGLHIYDGPAVAATRFMDEMGNKQRRGQGNGRGRVLKCYFNAITCF